MSRLQFSYRTLPNVGFLASDQIRRIQAEAVLELITNLHEMRQICGPLTEEWTALLQESVLNYQVMQFNSRGSIAFCEALFALPGDAPNGL